MTHALPLARIRTAVRYFVAWLEGYGKTSRRQGELFRWGWHRMIYGEKA